MKRNTDLDFLKFICCFLVICIHTPFPDITGKVVTTIARIAIPVFFMITGYFYSHVKESGGEIRQIIKIAKLFVLSNALYFVYGIFVNLMQGAGIEQILRGYFNKASIFQFVFLNQSPFSGHLWYLGAILYVLLIVYCFEKKWAINKLYFLIPFLLLTDLILGKYSLLIFGREFPFILVRNFLFVGLPYFLIGNMLCKYKPQIKLGRLSLLVVVFCLITLSESFLLSAHNLSSTRDHYLSTTFLSVFVFLFFLNFGNNSDDKLYKKCCFIGSKLSVYIYIIHPIVIFAVSVVENDFPVNMIFNYIRPFLVFLISTFASWVFYVCISRMPKIINNQKT